MVMNSEHDHAAPTAFTKAELAKEAEREVAVRTTVYAARVRDGKMKEQTATKQLGLMREIARRLRAEAERDEQMGRLV
jgi:hypothetical protein